MRKYLLFIYLIFVSCSQTYLEETQNTISINTRVSYDTLDTGVFIEWDIQWDFARVEISKGTEANQLTVFKDNLAQSTWLDTDNIPGQEYYYKITAYNSKNRIIGQSDIHKGYRAYRPYDQIVIPSNLKTYFAKYTDRIEIYWIGDEHDVFRLYRSDKLNDTPREIAELSFDPSEELKYIDKAVEPGKTYFYRVASVGKKTDSTIAVKMSTGVPLEGSAKIAPKGAKTSAIVGGIELTWDDDNVSEYYEIYRSETKESDYKLIVPFVKEEKYSDKNLPDIKGTYIEGTFTYPLYYYKIKAFAKGQASGFSDPVSGYAIDPADYLSAPENFTVAIDKSSYPYKLNFSWDAVGNNSTTYRLSKIDDKGVTNIIFDNGITLTHTTDNEEFSTQWEYIVQAINNDIGGLLGDLASKNYASSTPAPPKVLTISTNVRIYETNVIETNVESHIYWDNGKETSMTGIVKKEWHVTSKVGNIDLTWDKLIPSEFVAYYTIYRRKQGTIDFKKIADVDTLIHSDKLFTPEEYKGSGTGEDFVYPLYEYQITATFGGEESAPSAVFAGSAINPSDILLAPDYVTIPGHWASGNGFGTKTRWAKDPETDPLKNKSPKGVEKIVGKGKSKRVEGNHMFLTWGDVAEASTYRVRHSRGSTQENWFNKSVYPIDGTKKESFIDFDNRLGSDEWTGMYVTGDWLGYIKHSASFDVGSINGNAGYLLGDVRGIWFDEPDTKPAHY